MGEHDDELDVTPAAEHAGRGDLAGTAAAIASGLGEIAAAIERGLHEVAAAIASHGVRRLEDRERRPSSSRGR
jgi:hypothetical protein